MRAKRCVGGFANARSAVLSAARDLAALSLSPAAKARCSSGCKANHPDRKRVYARRVNSVTVIQRRIVQARSSCLVLGQGAADQLEHVLRKTRSRQDPLQLGLHQRAELRLVAPPAAEWLAEAGPRHRVQAVGRPS